MLLCASQSARAEFEIPQVNAEAGSIEAEYRGATHDGVLLAEPGEEADLEQSHELEFQLAPTDWWMYRIAPGLTQPLGGDLQYNDFVAETQFVLLRRPPEGLGVAFMFGYTKYFGEEQASRTSTNTAPSSNTRAGHGCSRSIRC